MIRIDRNVVPSPLSPELVDRADAALRDWFTTPTEARHRQSAPIANLRPQINRQARPSLFEVFRSKCAYCESFVDVSSPGEVDRFRPFTDASDLSGSGSPDHYPWLAAEWRNLYLACAVCARAKRSLFPVEGQRAEPLSSFVHVQALEAPLLLDPCFDDPGDHLQFLETGLVQPRSHRGEVTIKIFNLNRRGLVGQRAQTWARIDAALTSDPDRSFASLHGPDQAYVAVASAAFQASRAKNRPVRLRPPANTYARLVPADTRSAEEILIADGEAFRLTARPLRAVEIRNFRALRDVSLTFGEPGSEAAPWLMLLGENATGKSTALQAIALALAGAEEARRHTHPNKVLSVGAFAGVVRVWFWDQDTPAELTFNRDDERFGGTKGPSAIVLAYGAMRYAERRSRLDTPVRPAPRFTLISPIIQPIAKIRYPTPWLLQLDEKHFETAARALQAILPDASGAVMRRTMQRVYFEVDGHSAKLAELSAGYQTIIGMCADIMRLLFDRWDTLYSATAIVLIDELDAHLHPRWAMRIVGALREAFPRVQFIASTHDPLTLRGLRNREVALLRRDDGGDVVADQDLPPIEGLWVDQLLTSRAFGLNSTIDPQTEQLLNEYYHLLSLPPAPQHAERIAELRQRVGDREALGRSPAERLMLQAAAEFVAQVDGDRADSEPLRQETLHTLRGIAGGLRQRPATS